VLEVFQNMDYHKLNELLDEEAYYEDMKKTAFKYQQMQIFKELRKKGETYLNLSTNICTGCLCSDPKPVFVFTGNTSGLKYAIFVEFTDGEITDIYRRSEQSNSFDCLPSFLNNYLLIIFVSFFRITLITFQIFKLVKINKKIGGTPKNLFLWLDYLKFCSITLFIKSYFGR
jgi:hypothetical protein